MKRFKNFTKILSVALALIVFLSSFTVATSAINYEKVTVTPYDKLVNEDEEDTATPDSAFTIINTPKGVYAAAASSKDYHIYSNTSQGMRFKDSKLPFTFTNQITGANVTYPKNWGAWEYEYAKNDSTGAATGVWCIQPGVAINGATYNKNGEGADASYINKLNDKNHTALRNAMAATIAFGKVHKATENNEYYYAVGALLWDFVSGFRNPTTYEKIDGKTTYLGRAYCTKGDAFYNKVDSAKTVILNSLNKMNKPIPDIINDNKRVYASISDANKNRTNKEYACKMNPTDSSRTRFTGKAPVGRIGDYSDVKYEIVNQNDNSPSADRGFSLSYNKTKKEFTVSSTADLSTLSNTFYIKLTRSINYSESKSDVYWQTSSGKNQTMVNSLNFSLPVQTAYIPLFIDPPDPPKTTPPTSTTAPTTAPKKYGSFYIKKFITTNIDGVDYSGDYSGWLFEVYNQSTKETKYLQTDIDGITDTLAGIEVGTKLTIKEQGYVDDNGELNVNPAGFTSVTKTTEITITEDSINDPLEVEWENKCDLDMPFAIQKDTDDNGPVNGYYFLVFGSSNGLHKDTAFKTPTIIGPTDTNGEIEFYPDDIKNLNNNPYLYVVELGRLKKGQSTSFNRTVPMGEVANGAYRNRFEIPSQYTKPYNSMMESTFGIPDAIPLTITQTDLNNFYEDPYGYKKTFYITNMTEGYITVYKTDSVTKEPMKGVIYYVYQPSMNDSDEDDGSKEPVATIVTDENGYGQSPLLPTGEYYIVETKTDTYHYLDKTRYNITIKPGDNDLANAPKHIATNEPTKVTINKREVGTQNAAGAFIPGCLLQIFEKPASGYINFDTATPIYEFTTTGSARNITGLLELGKTYVLHEKSAPAGYCIADDVEFTADHIVTTVYKNITMIDYKTNIEVAKIDSVTNKYMAGAKLQIQDSAGKAVTVKDYDGNFVTSWISENYPLTIEGILESGKTYKLVELETLPGYTLAAPVSFTVGNDGELQTIKMANIPTKVQIAKLDSSTGKYMPDVTLQIQDSAGKAVTVKDYDGNFVTSWVTKDEPLTITGILESGKKYKLVELATKPGYTKAAPVSFTVRTDGQLQTITMYNDTTKVKLSKKDITGSEEIPGCTIELREKGSDKIIISWVSTNEPKYIEGVLEVGKTYVMRETNPASGYVTAPDFEFTVQNFGVVQTHTMKDDVTKVKVFKLDSSTKQNLENVKLQIQDDKGKPVKVRDYDGNLVESWLTRNTPLTIEGILAVNTTYKLVELETLPGYTLAAPVSFTVKDTGNVQSVTMYNDKTKVQIAKIDSSTGKYMPGVTLQIQDSAGKAVTVKDYDGNFVTSWVTKDEPLTITGILESGKKYKLVELATKPGYTKAAPVSFTVRTDGQLQTITMYNDTTKVKLSKKDITGSEEIPGCTIELREKGSDKVILSWVSTNEPKYIEGVLEVGKTYVMRETNPASGYVTAPDFEFTVQNFGVVQTHTMKDDVTKVQVYKIDKSTKRNLENVKLQIQDDKGKPVKVRDYDGNLVESWLTRNTPLTIEGILAVNKTYKLVELETLPGYTLAAPVSFTVKDTGNVQTVTMYNDTTKVRFPKLAADTNKQLPGCVMSLTDSSGKEIRRWTTTNEAYYLEGVLIAGETYTLTEISAAEGYMKAAPITFTVNNDGKEQVITMVDKTYARPDLPKTGGEGSVRFYVVSGLCFMFVGCIYLVRRKIEKNGKEQK